MNKTIAVSVLALTLFTWGEHVFAATQVEVGASAGAQVCTMEYHPVCGVHIRTDNQCVGDACKVYTTYSNACMMRADSATLAHDGACTPEESGQFEGDVEEPRPTYDTPQKDAPPVPFVGGMLIASSSTHLAADDQDANVELSFWARLVSWFDWI